MARRQKIFTQSNSTPENKETKLKKINYTPSTSWPAIASSCALWLAGTQDQPTDLFYFWQWHIPLFFSKDENERPEIKGFVLSVISNVPY